MTLILTVPTRLTIMAVDASSLIREGSAYFADSIDEARRPFVLVEPGSGDYPPSAAGVEDPTEEYTMTLFARSFGQGAREEAEIELRGITAEILAYFQRRTQLQFSNLRGLQLAPLGTLNGVYWARLYIRSYVGVVTKGGGEGGEGAFWGTVFSVRVAEVVSRQEVIV